MTSPIDDFDEIEGMKSGKSGLPAKKLRDYAVKLESEHNAINKALDDFRGHQETNVVVIRRLRKFYTHDRERYQARLAAMFEKIEELKLAVNDICEEILTG